MRGFGEDIPRVKTIQKQWDYRFQQCPTRYGK